MPAVVGRSMLPTTVLRGRDLRESGTRVASVNTRLATVDFAAAAAAAAAGSSQMVGAVVVATSVEFGFAAAYAALCREYRVWQQR